jgi:hypothetical protein
MRRGGWLLLLAVLPLVTVVAIRVAFHDRMGPEWRKEERARVAAWQAVATIPLNVNDNIADRVANIPLVYEAPIDSDQIAKLRETVERFILFAGENTFSRYWDFRVRSPYVDVSIPDEIREFMEKYFPETRLSGSGSNQLRMVFDNISFGSDMNHWGFEKISYDSSQIVVRTNSGPGSLLSSLMTREFPTGHLLRTNTYFQWRRSEDDLLAEGSPRFVATVRLFLSSSKTGVGHAYPVYLALVWNHEHQTWIPEELGASGNPPPQRSLFF